MVVIKVYKYDGEQEANGYKGEDFSSYVLQGFQNQDNLEDTLDTMEITLVGLPFREEFSPKTKFIVGLYDEKTDENGNITLSLWNDKELHFMVDTDTVEQPIISDNNYFNHHLSLIEPSVDMQNRLVDNIAVTYKLQDVTLNIIPSFDLSLRSKLSLTDTPSTNTNFKWGQEGQFWHTTSYYINGHKFEWVLPDWYNVNIDGEEITPKQWWENKNSSSDTMFKYFQEIPVGETTKTISFPVPMLKCSGSIAGGKSYRLNGYCSIKCRITDKDLKTNETTITTININPCSSFPIENAWTTDDVWAKYRAESQMPKDLPTGYIASRFYFATYVSSPIFAVTNVRKMDSEAKNRVVNLEMQANHSYSVDFSFGNDEVTGSTDSAFGAGWREGAGVYNGYYESTPAYFSHAYYSSYPFGINTDTPHYEYYVNNALPLANISFQAFEGSPRDTIVFSPAPPASAYDLFNKAQLSTQSFEKQEGIIVDETDKQIELEEADKQKLKDTTIVECFYNQKNLWEVLMDIGKYIHARPKLRFGSKGKYVVEWKQYGKTEQKQDNSNTISIYNARFVEDYISSLSSYVSNMVQLGGTIREVVFPKSSSEDFLVYNDVAEIKTNKNIIEIVEMWVVNKNTGERRGLTGQDPAVSFVQVLNNGEVNSLGIKNDTGFVFEENVYKTLAPNPNININKGFAIYYTLGTNVIKGLNYKLPSVNTGDVLNDYSIKNIIGCAFNMGTYSQWSQIKVNDYYFDIIYRTKDTLRTDQTRPDLRKYLMTTPYDRVPQHNQFANQTDTVIDSVKYGNNVYGKLIRTGNSTYEKIEWVEDLSFIKRAGDLYSINNQWYYVTKVSNTFYADHIVSEVSFSKDFNKLSQIIGIPSEPRFYEISEQSSIKREVGINDFIVIGTDYVEHKEEDISFLQNKAMSYIGGLLMSPINDDRVDNTGEETPFEYPRYIVTTFRNDLEKVVQQNTEVLERQVLLPASTYSLENTLTIEWDTLNNVVAGDKLVPTNGYTNGENDRTIVDTAYNILEAVQYCDKYGRADMFNFAILQDHTLSSQEIEKLPENSIDLSTVEDELLFGDQNAEFYSLTNGNKNKGRILLKDNREHICFNYNLQALTDSDRFVLSAYLWQQGKKKLRIALLNEEVNKLSNSTIENRAIEIGEIPFTYTVDDDNKTLKINIAQALENAGITNEKLNGIKAIVVYSDVYINDSALSSSKYFVIARNIDGLSFDEIRQDWKISRFSKSMFKQQ